MSTIGKKLHEEVAVWFFFPGATLGESQNFIFPVKTLTPPN